MTATQYKHVLIIDDNEVDNYITQRVLKKATFATNIDVCKTGQKALDFIKSRMHNLDQIPDMIFLDLNMPIVDGFIFLFAWNDFPVEVRQKCQIIVLSSMLDVSVINKVTNNPYVKDFIPKPLSQSALKRLQRKHQLLKSA